MSTQTIPSIQNRRMNKMEYIRSVDSLARKVDISQEGFFDPSSMHWKIYREPIVILVAHSALFLQIAHPAVGQGVLDYSRFRKAYKVPRLGYYEKDVYHLLWFNTLSQNHLHEALRNAQSIQRTLYRP